MTTEPKPLTMNTNYLAMVRGTRELHQLLIAGKDDSPEADALFYGHAYKLEPTNGNYQAMALYSLTSPTRLPRCRKLKK
jgi:hypothetical protein